MLNFTFKFSKIFSLNYAYNFKNLTFWVLAVIFAGVFLGHFKPEIALFKIFEEPLKAKFLGQEL